jgi:hypothetical protein
MATNYYGTIRADEAYTAEQLALMFNKSRQWVLDTYVRPVDANDKRKTDRDGNPIPGVHCHKQGGTIIILGQSLLGWIAENGTRAVD